MPIYYVKPDSDNQFPDKDTTPELESADGLRAVNIPFSSIQYFVRRWWMYRFKSDNSQEMVSPGNLYPDLDIDYLRGLTDQQAEVIETQAKTIQDLQKASGQIGGAQAQTAVDTTSLKKIAAQLGGQLAQIQVQLAAIDTATKTE